MSDRENAGSVTRGGGGGARVLGGQAGTVEAPYEGTAAERAAAGGGKLPPPRGGRGWRPDRPDDLMLLGLAAWILWHSIEHAAAAVRELRA